MATDFAVSLRRFLTDHMAGLRGCSPNTISSYRDTFKLLIVWFRDERYDPARTAHPRTPRRRPRSPAFLAWLRTERHNSPSTCNQRLAAISSFFRWLQTQDPARMACCQDILAIPSSKHDQPPIAHLTVEQTRLLLALPDRSTRQGRRDATLLATLYDTAARVQETADLTVRDIRLEDPADGRADRQRPQNPARPDRRATPRRCWPPTSPNAGSTAPAVMTTRCSSTNTGRNSAAAGSPGSCANTRPRPPTRRSPAPN